MKVKDISWFQKGSFSDMDSVPTRVLRLWLLDTSLIWLVLAPISAPSSQPNTLGFTVLTRHMKNSAGQDMLGEQKKLFYTRNSYNRYANTILASKIKL